MAISLFVLVITLRDNVCVIWTWSKIPGCVVRLSKEETLNHNGEGTIVLWSGVLHKWDSWEKSDEVCLQFQVTNVKFENRVNKIYGQWD